ncbi:MULTISPECIES: metal-binding protein [Providencia]|uniref:metal-binding protein n=1 Tax=Providencia TaxID=586 RepID=UPI001B38B782|nr:MULTISPECIES: metal-binding protein [Providencia]MBQ0531877.1 metal-binding protein [Providencia rettgeri]WOB85502.1 metal-binding protein [Providencia sp. PROV040]
MSKISERIKELQTSKPEGYCVVCDSYTKLTYDHVPPQGAITVTKIEQKHVTEMIGLKKESLRGAHSTNGSKFRTVCKDCNSQKIGLCDMEVARVNKILTQKISDFFYYKNNPSNIVSTKFNSIEYARAMIGHILTATTPKECESQDGTTTYFTPLKNFVLGDNTAINETHDIYYWFYPRERHVSAKIVNFYNEGHFALISLLAFYPIAFLITEKGKGIYPANALKYTLGMDYLSLDLSTNNLDFVDFPFIKLEDNNMYLLNSAQAIMSYPIKNK